MKGGHSLYSRARALGSEYCQAYVVESLLQRKLFLFRDDLQVERIYSLK